MQFKPINAIIVLSLVVAALLIAGCTTTTPTNSPNQPSTAYPTGGARSELLQGIEANFSKTPGYVYKATWINNTALTTQLSTESTTWEYKFIHFPTIEAATAYFNSYSLALGYKDSSGPLYSDLYADAAGVRPSVTKDAYRAGSFLEQLDSLIIVSSSTTATETPTATPTSSSDQSSYITSKFSDAGYTIVTPFKKSTNSYGNVVYTGVVKDTPEKKLNPYSHSITIELTKNSSATKARYAQYKTQLVSSGLVKEFDYGDYMTFYDGSTYTNPPRESYLDMNEPSLINHIYNTGVYLNLSNTFMVTLDDTTKL